MVHVFCNFAEKTLMYVFRPYILFSIPIRQESVLWLLKVHQTSKSNKIKTNYETCCFHQRTTYMFFNKLRLLLHHLFFFIDHSFLYSVCGCIQLIMVLFIKGSRGRTVWTNTTVVTNMKEKYVFTFSQPRMTERIAKSNDSGGTFVLINKKVKWLKMIRSSIF